jgi:hypothetical protein
VITTDAFVYSLFRLQRAPPFPPVGPVTGRAREDERSKLVRKVAALRKRASRTKFTTGLDHYAEETLNTVSVCVFSPVVLTSFFFGTTFVSFFGTF